MGMDLKVFVEGATPEGLKGVILPFVPVKQPKDVDEDGNWYPINDFGWYHLHDKDRFPEAIPWNMPRDYETFHFLAGVVRRGPPVTPLTKPGPLPEDLCPALKECLDYFTPEIAAVLPLRDLIAAWESHPPLARRLCEEIQEAIAFMGICYLDVRLILVFDC